MQQLIQTQGFEEFLSQRCIVTAWTDPQVLYVDACLETWATGCRAAFLADTRFLPRPLDTLLVSLASLPTGAASGSSGALEGSSTTVTPLSFQRAYETSFAAGGAEVAMPCGSAVATSAAGTFAGYPGTSAAGSSAGYPGTSAAGSSSTEPWVLLASEPGHEISAFRREVADEVGEEAGGELAGTADSIGSPANVTLRRRRRAMSKRESAVFSLIAAHGSRASPAVGGAGAGGVLVAAAPTPKAGANAAATASAAAVVSAPKENMSAEVGSKRQRREVALGGAAAPSSSAAAERIEWITSPVIRVEANTKRRRLLAAEAQLQLGPAAAMGARPSPGSPLKRQQGAVTPKGHTAVATSAPSSPAAAAQLLLSSSKAAQQSRHPDVCEVQLAVRSPLAAVRGGTSAEQLAAQNEALLAALAEAQERLRSFEKQMLQLRAAAASCTCRPRPGLP